jgi:hypothetical protein
MRLHYATLLAIVIVAAAGTGAAKADICVEHYKEGRAIHAELQRKAISELNDKNYAAACKTMQHLADLSLKMRRFSEANCWRNPASKRMHANADNIAARAQEICAQAKMH